MSIKGRMDNGEPCDKCGEVPTAEGHDACIGTLPNIMNACCGHGGRNEPYVQFYSSDDAMRVDYVSAGDIDESNCIRGEKAARYILGNSKRGGSSMVEQQPSKLKIGVRSPVTAP